MASAWTRASALAELSLASVRGQTQSSAVLIPLVEAMVGAKSTATLAVAITRRESGLRIPPIDAHTLT